MCTPRARASPSLRRSRRRTTTTSWRRAGRRWRAQTGRPSRLSSRARPAAAPSGRRRAPGGTTSRRRGRTCRGQPRRQRIAQSCHELRHNCGTHHSTIMRTASADRARFSSLPTVLSDWRSTRRRMPAPVERRRPLDFCISCSILVAASITCRVGGAG